MFFMFALLILHKTFRRSGIFPGLLNTICLATLQSFRIVTPFLAVLEWRIGVLSGFWQFLTKTAGENVVQKGSGADDMHRGRMSKNGCHE